MCEICRQTPCHPRCPNAKSPKIMGICSICRGAIESGEEIYQVSEDEAIHADCVQGFTLEEMMDLQRFELSDTFRNADIDGDLIMRAFGIYKTQAEGE